MSRGRFNPRGRPGGGASNLRQSNLSEILRYLRDYGPSSRHAVAVGCGLGVSTLTDLVGELRRRGLVVELDAIRRSGAGRPTRPIDLDGSRWAVLGVQLHPRSVILHWTTVGGESLALREVALDLGQRDAETGYQDFADVLATELRDVPDDRPPVALVVGVPGYVSGPDGTLSWSPYLAWAGLPLRTRLAGLLASLEMPDVYVGVDHDVHLAGLFAVRRELSEVPQAAVYIGGVRELAGAMVLNGEIFAGGGGGAGDFGHLQLDPQGPECACGRRGCLQSLAGPAALLERSGLYDAEAAVARLAEDPSEVLLELRSAAEEDRLRAREALAEGSRWLTVGLQNVVGMLNPEVLLVGGWTAWLREWLVEPVGARLVEGVSPGGTPAVLVPLIPRMDRVYLGAAIIGQDACLADPLTLTRPLAALPAG